MSEQGYLSNCPKCGHDRSHHSVKYCDGYTTQSTLLPCYYGVDEHLHGYCVCGYSWREECKDKKN
jgi:hypothetical protein